jgi:hypothetical protein
LSMLNRSAEASVIRAEADAVLDMSWQGSRGSAEEQKPG